ncbi:hypothetical protein Dsin_018991 [Dipteronia sinensis]|uniref:Uncharacterized protein n=1 Tax=Dipteronia sinensis TaxID=43782 RepID=A0AAE0A6D2_9ROSI|nr:hypothetical protein Dsin_018991 [Dipteronia sinensis]
MVETNIKVSTKTNFGCRQILHLIKERIFKLLVSKSCHDSTSRLQSKSLGFVGAPLAVARASVWKLGFVGLCCGFLGAQIACVVSNLTVVFKTDWERESLKARDLVGGSNKIDDHDHDDRTVLIKYEEGGLVGLFDQDQDHDDI